MARVDYDLIRQRLIDLAHGRDRSAVADELARADLWWAVADRQRRTAPGSDEAARFVAKGQAAFRESAGSAPISRWPMPSRKRSRAWSRRCTPITC